MGLEILRILGTSGTNGINSVSRINAFATKQENNATVLGNPNRPVHYNTDPNAGPISTFDILA